jgi:uncharacterized protein GlcG (DUF336 family)
MIEAGLTASRKCTGKAVQLACLAKTCHPLVVSRRDDAMNHRTPRDCEEDRLQDRLPWTAGI